MVIQSDNPLSYDETGEFPPYDGIDADTLEGHPADDFMLKEDYNPSDLSEYLKESEADTKYATKSHTHTTSQVTGLDSALAGKANSSHSHSISDVTNLQSTLNNKANANHTHTISQITDMPDINNNNAIPSGIIVMWSGITSNIPSGWHLCDGNSGTPDLRDRFIIGAGSSHNPNDKGGNNSTSVTIPTNALPNHTHTFTGSSHTHTGSLSGATAASAGVHTHSVESAYVSGTTKSARANEITLYDVSDKNNTTSSSGAHTHTVSGSVRINSATTSGTVGSTGSGQAFTIDTIPAYYALCFIMKL